MTHSIKGVNGNKVSAEESKVKTCLLSIGYSEQVELNLEQLHSFIGTMLHVQAKMKK